MIRVIKNVLYSLTVKQKVMMLKFVVLMFLGGFLETLGVSLIIPIVKIVLDERMILNNSVLRLIYESFNVKTTNQFVIILLVFLAIVFFVKNIFILWEYYLQNTYIATTKKDLQNRVMQAFLKQPYEYFLGESTGSVQRAIIEDVNCGFSVLSELLTIITEGIVCLVIFCSLMYVDKSMTLFVVIVLMIESILIVKIIRPHMNKAGVRVRQMNALKNKWIIQAVEGIKETKIACKEKFFLDKYMESAGELVGLDRKYKILDSLPRLCIESITVAAMICYLIIMLFNNKNPNEIIPQLSAFAVAAVRVIPCFNRISSSYARIGFLEPGLNGMVTSLKWISSQKQDETSKCFVQTNDKYKDSFCVFENVSYHYPSCATNVLENVSFDIPRGKAIGIVGTSGAGKTTLVDIMLGLLKPQAGKIYFEGKDICGAYEEWLSKVAYIPQSIFLMDDTIRANILYGADSEDDSRVWDVIKQARLEEYVAGLPNGLDTQVGDRGIRLSGGQRQRIGIARALYTNPELLVFDEATASLDNETESEIMDAIEQLYGNKTIIIIAHRLSTISKCDVVYRVKNKKAIIEYENTNNSYK